jgi:hypothetical protein
MESITSTISSMGNYTVLLFLYMYISSLIGMQMFAGKLKYDKNGFPDSNGESPRLNFDNIWITFLTIFTVIIGDNWNEIMYNCMRSTNMTVGFLYFLSLIVFGQIVMLNLFLAILLGTFDASRLYLSKT